MVCIRTDIQCFHCTVNGLYTVQYMVCSVYCSDIQCFHCTVNGLYTVQYMVCILYRYTGCSLYSKQCLQVQYYRLRLFKNNQGRSLVWWTVCSRVAGVHTLCALYLTWYKGEGLEDDITLAFNKIRVNVQQRWVHCTVYNAYTEQYTMRTLHSVQWIHCTLYRI